MDNDDFPARASAFGAWAGVETETLAAKPVEREGLCVVAAREGQSAALRQKLRALYGVEAPSGPRCAAHDDITLIAAAPNIWLMAQPDAERTLAAELRDHLAGLASIADQSGAYARLRIGGRGAAALLQKGVFIDMAAFEPGTAAVTHVAHLGLILWRTSTDDTFDLALFRSTARDFVHWLEHAAGSGKIKA